MKKLLMVSLFCLMPVISFGQTLDVTYGVGRTYDIPTYNWGISNIPGLEFNWKNLQVQLFTQFNANYSERTETDISVSYEKRLTDRMSMSLNYSAYNYPMRTLYGYGSHGGDLVEEIPTDHLWYTEVKWRLFGK